MRKEGEKDSQSYHCRQDIGVKAKESRVLCSFQMVKLNKSVVL